MSKWKDVARLFDLELEEEFKLKWGGDIRECKFTDAGIFEIGRYGWEQSSYFVTLALLKGEAEVIKKPWKPKEGDGYWYFSVTTNKPSRTVFEKTPFDYHTWKVGNCFKTEEEADAKGKGIVGKLKEEYENA